MNLLEQFKPIKTFVFDVDGVLTDGSLLVLDSGEQVRKMSIRDGYALQLAIKKGYRVVIISGGISEGVRNRLHKLGVKDVFMSIEDKAATMEGWISKNGATWSEILFMGDDLPDFELMKKAAMCCAPVDAATEIKAAARYISTYKGGEGCARDVIEKVLRLNDQWTADTSVAAR